MLVLYIEVEQLERRNSRKAEKITAEYDLYRTTLGVRVRTLDAETMQFAFYNIERSNPDAVFTVSIRVVGDKYFGRLKSLFAYRSQRTNFSMHFSEIMHANVRKFRRTCQATRRERASSVESFHLSSSARI